MNISELCIRPPDNDGSVIGVRSRGWFIAYGDLPIAALPSYDSPTISVTAVLPGASRGNNGLVGGGAT